MKLIKPTSRLVAGYDVGRKRDFAVLEIFEEQSNGVMIQRYEKEFDRASFEVQSNHLRAALNILPIARLSIDATGMGIQLAETLEAEYPATVVPEVFTTVTKEIWCGDFKIGLQRKTIELTRDRSLISQIHSIKRSVTAGGRVTYDVEKGEDGKGHADKFWACALACQKQRALLRQTGEIGCRILG